MIVRLCISQSRVDNVILDAPSLAKEEQTDSCEACGEGIYGILAELQKDG